MEDVAQTPKPVHSIFKAGHLQAKPVPPEQIFSSSPGFGTPAYTPHPRRNDAPVPIRPGLAFEPQLRQPNAQTVLPILLPPQTLRPVAFRTLTKKHNLTITSSGLGALASFIGKFCGAEWRQSGSGERVLDEIAKQWKRDNGGLILDDNNQDKKLKNILKCLEPCMSAGKLDLARLSRSNSAVGSLSRQPSDLSRPDVTREDSQNSLGISGLDVRDEEMELDDHVYQDARSYLKVVGALQQPNLVYSTTKKTLELVTAPPGLLPPIQQKIAAYRNRYNLVHQRLMRNEAFQTTSFSSTTGRSLNRSGSNIAPQHAYKITPISNLLGRTGSTHLLLGLLVYNAAGDLSLSDLTGSVVIDLLSAPARAVPDDQAWFCPGMIVLVEGTYEEDGSNTSTFGSSGGVGGQIRGKFIADTIAGPPAERREVTLGIGHNYKADSTHTVAGAGYGWFDFLGTGSEKALGSQMRRIQRKVLGHTTNNSIDVPEQRTKLAILGECNLDSPLVLQSIRAVLSTYTNTTFPLAIIFLGNFCSSASMAGSTKGGSSIEYKESFDALASVLSEFPTLLSSTTLIFVPGDNDPWASSFSAGAATCLPHHGIPELFTTRIKRAINTANTDNPKRPDHDPGHAVWTSNPARISLFGPVDDLVLFRDDITGRLRRNAIPFSAPPSDDPETASPSTEPDSHPQPQPQPQTTPRRLAKLLLDQAHLAPFPATIRPTLHGLSHALHLHPLPTVLVLCDPETDAFTVTYEGCHVVNVARVVGESGRQRRVARWCEVDVRERRGVERSVDLGVGVGGRR